jgi:hypothetical protein
LLLENTKIFGIETTGMELIFQFLIPAAPLPVQSVFVSAAFVPVSAEARRRRARPDLIFIMLTNTFILVSVLLLS